MFKRIIDTLTCSHRHTIDEHSACFATGNVNLERAKAMEDRYGKPWYQVEGHKIGVIDIEADGLKADFSTMLTWCIKEKGGVVYHDSVNKEELFSGVSDRRLVQSLVDKMSEYKILIGYYSTGYDIPFVRAKALHYGINFPGYISETVDRANGTVAVVASPEIYHFDMYYVVKSKLAISRKSLDNACDFLGIKGKTPIDKDAWRAAKYGDPAALAQVLEHNIGDVEILDELHNRLSPFARFTRKGI